ncbi:cytochrome P450 71B10-like [Rhododendron vialii]|uniref:cytochrome P450 71B10-like n=1 Tax=Rhododendron vialii TaxID=182163 RepID=UPI00265FB650|nr:cytochrome P450 71B10-like [Rhododendron vialii]
MTKTFMDFLSPTSLILLLLSSLISIWFSIRIFKKPSNLPPGPPQLPIIGNLHQLMSNLPHRSLYELSKRYGPVMHLRLGQVPTLVVSSPEMAKQVLKTHDLVCCSRPVSRGPKRLSYNFLDVAFVPYSNYWREMRKLCIIELFNVKRVQSFGHVREEQVGQLIKSLSKGSGDPVELSERIFSLTNNVLCRIAFGKSYEGRQFASGKFQATIDEAMAMLSSFWGSDFFPYVGWIVDVLSGLHSRLEKLFHDFDGFFERVIEDHVDPTRKRSENEDFTDILLGLAQDQTASFRLTRDHIKAVLMNIFLGGIDTSSLTVVWAMTELARNPRVMQKVQAEIRSHVGKNSKVDETLVENLKYLKMVVKETFRLHPTTPLLIPRESTRHCQISGYNVYPKTRILVNVWAIGRDPEVWENPGEFCPERFEGSEIDFKGQNFELVPFGAGRRICPGLTMGATVVEFILANLLHCFNWELPEGMKREDISLEEGGGLTVHKKLPLYLVPVGYKWQDYKS